MNKITRSNLLHLFIAAAGMFLVNGWWNRSQTVAVIPYSPYQQLLEKGNVQEVVVGADSIEGVLRQPLQGSPYQG